MSGRLLRVQLVHGLESNPQGSKARTLAAHFDALTPAVKDDVVPTTSTACSRSSTRGGSRSW